jgi:hypothetical protein
MTGSFDFVMTPLRQIVLSIVVVAAPVLVAFPCCCERAAAEVSGLQSQHDSCCIPSNARSAKSCCSEKCPDSSETSQVPGSCPPDRDCWCCLPDGYLRQLCCVSQSEPTKTPDPASLPIVPMNLAVPADSMETDGPPDATRITPRNRNQAQLCVWRN